MQQTYPTYNPRRAALLAALVGIGVDPSERPVSRLNPAEQAGGSYAGPRFDPSLVSRGSYTGPKFSVSRTDADAQGDGYAGPKFAIRTEQPADADRVVDEPRQYPVYNPPAAPQQYPTFKAPPDSSVTAGPAGDDLYTGPKGPVTPKPSATEQDAARVRDLLSNPPANTNSRGGGALRLMAFDAAREAQSGSLGRTTGAALGGLFSGLVNKTADEQIIDRPQQLARAQAQLGLDTEVEKERREAEALASETRLRNANANYIETQKPLNDEATRLDKAKRAFLAQLGKMPSIDPQKHAAFLSAWQRLNGEPFDVDAYNNRKGNIIVRGLITDPSKPQEKNDVAINLATGGQTVLGLSGYTPPRDTSGMTEGERRTDADRDRAFMATERQRRIQNEFSRLRIAQGDKRITLAQVAQDNRVSEETRKESLAADKLRAQAEEAQSEANDYADKGWYKDKDTGEMRRAKWAVQRETQAKERAESLRTQLYDEYGYLWSSDGQGAPQMTMQDFLRNHPSFESSGHREGDKVVPMTTGDILAAARRYGVTITDAGQPQTTPSAPGSNMPRRGAPGRAHSSAPAAGEDPMIRSYANDHFGGDYNAALKAIQEQRARKGH
jgi:hypothetical protein